MSDVVAKCARACETERMSHENPSDEQLRKLLSEARTVAVVGASAKAEKPSHGVFQKLLAVGYRVIPVNPNEAEVLGQKAYPSLSAIPEPVDIVDVFRRPELTLPLAAEAASIGAKVLWLQSGIIADDTAEAAEALGLTVVMDLCMGVEAALLGIKPQA